MKTRKAIAIASWFLSVLGAGYIGYLVGDFAPSEHGPDKLQLQFSNAAKAGHLERLKSLRDQGARLDAITYDDAGATQFAAIQMAAYRGDHHMVSWLIQNGSNVNFEIGPATPLDLAETHLNEVQETIRLLKMAGGKHWSD